uniref:Dpp6 protein n=1 Tax=Fopius arisanus TaxID=64838 RepID=A0A0C9R0D8_9HYME
MCATICKLYLRKYLFKKSSSVFFRIHLARISSQFFIEENGDGVPELEVLNKRRKDINEEFEVEVQVMEGDFDTESPLQSYRSIEIFDDESATTESLKKMLESMGHLV